MVSPSVSLAAIAGVASFLSPCMLPVIPAFLARIGSVTAVKDTGTRRLFAHTLVFVIGFSVVFSVLGVALESALSDTATEVRVWLARAAGVFVIGFGLHLAGLLDIPRLERGSTVPDIDTRGLLGSGLLGGAFAVTWTPCVGPILGSTFALAATEPAAAFPIFVAYSVGLGVPFLVFSLIPERAESVLSGHRKKIARLNHAFGFVIVGLGVLIFTRRLELLGFTRYTLEIV